MTNFEGHKNPECHRTVGEHRARCGTCNEWCYPEDTCRCCLEEQTEDEFVAKHLGNVLAEVLYIADTSGHDPVVVGATLRVLYRSGVRG